MLQELTNKIKKIIPEIEDYYDSGSYSVFDDDGIEVNGFFNRDINLEDVLRCLDINSTDKNWYLGASSNMFRIEYINEENIKNSKCAIWQLGKPLHEQSEETIKELNKYI